MLNWKYPSTVACAMTLGSFASAQTIDVSLRPIVRPTTTAIGTALSDSADATTVTSSALTSPAKEPSDKGLRNWIEAFETRALKEGIDAATFQNAFANVRYDADVIRRDRNQSEFTKTIWDYLDTAVSDVRIRNGKAALTKHNDTLVAIERMYGVEKEVVVAIWGLESAYGSFRGSNSAITSLATLAYDGRRGPFFEGQLVAALKILQNGDTNAGNMTGSWAGAMGHTQFMPTSYLDYAVDFTGDGKRDIWSDDPTDALASTAAYLKSFGWEKGIPWGVEVTLPKGFDYTQAAREIKKRPADWARLGVKSMRKSMPESTPVSLLLPAGAQGAAFLISDNFEVIERYNTADAYVIGIGHLSDRIKGLPAIKAPWPRTDRALTLDERVELQKALTKNGFDTVKIDGKIGPLTINAVRAYQISAGKTPDGYASLRLLESLR